MRTRSRTLVSDIDVDVRAGQVTALVGPSGVGKSLTARCLMGLVDVDPGLAGGSLRYPGLEADRDWYRDHLGGGRSEMQRLARETSALRGSFFTYAPQVAASALNPGRTIGRQVVLAMARRTPPVEDPGREVRGLLAEVGLAPRTAGSLPQELSGGQCQRAALAVAIAPHPSVVVADEPETGLDPILRRGIIELLVRVCRDRGCGLLLISHHEDTVTRIADIVVRFGTPEGIDA
ncbi:MAG: ATP-binding cassette domain-containing protein [Deltaproteobacteria bacterium]|nr:ATP-binding cassette domain-containing protein [Deltaproteobacteria bacterium]